MAQLSECEAVAICAVRAPDKAPFGDQERDRLCPVAYHLGQWGKAFWFARRAAAGASAARRALELGAGHVVCIDDEKRPLWEQGAGDLQSIGLERFDGRIRGVSKACERLLAVAVARSIAAPAGPVETVRLKRGEVRVCGDGGALEPHVALLCWQSRRVIAAPVQASKAEQQTIALLVSGLSPEEIARRRDVKVSTVRTQIKRLYRKLGVHSVAQLLAKVNPA
jgi:DNA-binding CsgD family transcriptional regulator